MNYEPVHFHKTARIDQSDNSLPGGHFSLRMLILDLVPAATFLRFFSEVAQLLGQFLHRHCRLELAEETSRIKARKIGSRVQSKSPVRNCYASPIRLDDDASIEVDSNGFSTDPTVAGFDEYAGQFFPVEHEVVRPLYL